MALSKELPIWPQAARANAGRSIVAAHLVIEGGVTSAGSVDIEGRIFGTIRAPQVVVAETGWVQEGGRNFSQRKLSKSSWVIA